MVNEPLFDNRAFLDKDGKFSESKYRIFLNVLYEATHAAFKKAEADATAIAESTEPVEGTCTAISWREFAESATPGKYYMDQIMAPGYDHLCLEDELMDDINHVIASIAKKYTDQTCQFLQFDMLFSDNMAKLAKIVNKFFFKRKGKHYLSHLSRSRHPTRGEFFRFFKTAVNNNTKGLVHRYRYTTKRTGVKAPPRNQPFDPTNFDSFARTKNVELSLDDPNCHVQISDAPESGYMSWGSNVNCDLLNDIRSFCNPLEVIVLNQLDSPNDATLIFAILDAWRGKKKGSSVKVAIKLRHLAEGIGVPSELFEATQKSIQKKVKTFMENSDKGEDVRYNLALQQLEELFQLVIPRSIDATVVRRMLTIAARDQYSKVTADVGALLDIVGAKVPKEQAGMLACYGALYQKGNRVCMACGLQQACAVECANVGLGEVTISPKLLGAKQNTRIPALLANTGAMESDITFTNDRDDELFNHLSEHFRRTDTKGEVGFRHKELGEKGTVLIAVVSDGSKHRFKVCRPSSRIVEELERVNNVHYIPTDCTADDAIELISKHAEEAFHGATVA